MNRLIGVLPALLLALAVTHAQAQPAAKPKSEPDEKLLLAGERAVHEAVAKADKASFVSLVLPDGVWASPNTQGFVPLKLLADGLDGFKLSKWDIVNPHVTWLTDDSAVVLYAWKGSGTFGDQPITPTTLASTTWTRRNGKWLAAHHQETELVGQE
jgi:hypothetical protein